MSIFLYLHQFAHRTQHDAHVWDYRVWRVLAGRCEYEEALYRHLRETDLGLH